MQLTALPSQGHYFFGWANAASGFANPLLFNVTNVPGITALFGALKRTKAPEALSLIGSTKADAIAWQKAFGGVRCHRDQFSCAVGNRVLPCSCEWTDD